jgi:Zn-dependent protease
MASSWKIGKAFGIDVYIHWSFWLLPAWVALLSAGFGGSELALNLGVLAAAFGCVVLHELGHALTARRFGIPTRDITLYPIGGVASLERMSERPLHEFCIAVAGPLVNVVIAALLTCFLLTVTVVKPGAVLGSLGGLFLVRLLIVNVMMVLFNLLPAFPMDGGRVLRALLALRLGQLRATRIAAGIGVAMALLLGLAGAFLLHSPWLMAIGFFVYFAGQQELAAVEYRECRRRAEMPEEPLRPEVPPVFTMEPRLTVYTWDDENGRWVPARQVRPDRVG